MTQDDVSIRLLEKDNNRRGDLFGRLMADLFVALGYEQPRLNIHKSGRELDLQADHRLESRRAIAECKATSDPIGGDELNKFVGVLDAERKEKIPITGFFISLGGFRETAVEQERQGRRTKIILLTGPKVVRELIRGRIIAQKERAIELAGRCCATHNSLLLDSAAELLAHERGWIWAIYYGQGKVRTHVVLIHSDGTPLARVLADELIAADRESGGGLQKLICLNPAPPPGADSDPEVATALSAYHQYLENECGYIQLDGLPADGDIGARQLRLENLFVPLHLDVTVLGDKKKERQLVGSVLSQHPRLALLAPPGGGKSTLIKRLAIAYSDAARLGTIGDDLPQRDWLPLFCRCRELRELARGSFAELLESISLREPVRQKAQAFRAYVDRALLAGRVLLLIDGLDEISDPGDRAAFVCMLRTALQAYPGTAMVLTSREAGFRHVAAQLAPVCTPATLSPFNSEDISRLCVTWHREVVGDTEKVRADAEQLAATIVQSDRIVRLAVNPLLLTTLLLVRRWVGTLPTRRAILYGKAIEMLLITWNTQGHDPIPEDEAMPQLCFVAASMMLSGVQKVSRPKLAALLQGARDALPTELGYVQDTVDGFIQRVEDRSSLLMMTGHDVDDGKIVEFFEFRHLTFQEFLAARGMVEGWHPGRKKHDTLVRVLEPHFVEEKWGEVIPLAAALGGKSAETLIQCLTDRLRDARQKRNSGRFIDPIVKALSSCLADEAAARPVTIRAALRELVQSGSYLEMTGMIRVVARGRYGPNLREESGKAYLASVQAEDETAVSLAATVWWQTVEAENESGFGRAGEQLVEMLHSHDKLARCEGALGFLYLCFRMSMHSALDPEAYAELLSRGATALQPLLSGKDDRERSAAVWAYVWLGACGTSRRTKEPDILESLFELWQRGGGRNVRTRAAWALSAQPLDSLPSRQRFFEVRRSEIEQLAQGYDQMKTTSVERAAVLVVIWYTRGIWSSFQFIRRAEDFLRESGPSEKYPPAPRIKELVKRLRDDGGESSQELDPQQEKSKVKRRTR